MLHPTIFAILLYVLVGAFKEENYLLAGIALLIVVLYVVSIPLVKQVKIKEIRESISNAEEKHFMDINKAPYWIIKELPGITELEAKKAVWGRRSNGNYKTVEDFIEKVKISPPCLPRVLDIIYVEKSQK